MWRIEVLLVGRLLRLGRVWSRGLLGELRGCMLPCNRAFLKNKFGTYIPRTCVEVGLYSESLIFSVPQKRDTLYPLSR